MNTLAYLMNEYGPLLTMTELAKVLKYKTKASILNAISAERFPIPTHPQGGNKRVALTRDVAAHIDSIGGGAVQAKVESDS